MKNESYIRVFVWSLWDDSCMQAWKMYYLKRGWNYSLPQNLHPIASRERNFFSFPKNSMMVHSTSAHTYFTEFGIKIPTYVMTLVFWRELLAMFTHIRTESSILTHWGRVPQFCAVIKQSLVCQREAIIWPKSGILSIDPPGTNFIKL